MNAQFQRWSLIACFTAVLFSVSCSGRVWPSQGMTVNISNSGVSTVDVVKAAESVLQADGFRDAGRDGRDEIKNQRNAYYFQGPNDIQVVITVDRKDIVQIRVNQNQKSFSPEASHLFKELATALEVILPGKIVKEAAPTRKKKEE